MGHKLKPLEIELYKKIDNILYNEWDPIGISGFAPEDEYHSYLPLVFKLAIENASSQSIADYLTTVRTQTMGLSPDDKHDLKISKIILQLKQDIGL